ASTQFFDDTTLMALLCRHDVVLFIANMRSAGEKQHYVMVLVETFFQHLPPPYRVGLPYDIGCQTEHSCIKWGFLDCYIERIIFGISVFHAFGHQWDCGKLETELRAEWKDQVETQTKPLLRQSQNAGKGAIKELLQMREARDGLKKREREYDALIEDEATPMDEYTEVKAD
ncbi:hypothetical protein DXG01_008814, partial [Tephrocybe rancida]